ncbi:MAG: recombinase family protein [Candidatus Saccharimonadales bacterium]
MWRVAIYGREAPGRAGRARLDRQVTNLAAHIARQPGWQHVATYGDQGFGLGRPGLSRLLAEAPGGAGVRVVVLRPSPGRRLARMVANLALADMIGEAAR